MATITLITTGTCRIGARPLIWPDNKQIAVSAHVYLEYMELDPPKDAIADAETQGWGRPVRLRCWRSSMRTMDSLGQSTGSDISLL